MLPFYTKGIFKAKKKKHLKLQYFPKETTVSLHGADLTNCATFLWLGDFIGTPSLFCFLLRYEKKSTYEDDL